VDGAELLGTETAGGMRVVRLGSATAAKASWTVRYGR